MPNSRAKSSGQMSVLQSCSQDTVKQHSSQSLGRWLQSFLFFILFYLYLWLYVDPRLIYHGGGIITNFPSFYKGWTFFLTFPRYPGGLIEYLSAFLVQFFYFPWAGALVITAQAWLLSFCFDYLLKATNLRQYPGFALVHQFCCLLSILGTPFILLLP